MISLILGDCLEVMTDIPDSSVDAVITDPPYAEIDREYGRLTESEWHTLMRGVVAHCRCILKPSGSAVFVLQANQEKIGRTRAWLWEFMAWTAREWNQVQDAWWWNHAALPNSTAIQGRLLRPSVKACVWLGAPDCYRDQGAVLWTESQANVALRATARSGRTVFPSGHSVDETRISQAAIARGGVLPFNLIPVANTNSSSSAGSRGHGAGTPHALCDWWTRYICPAGGVILDPFMGAGTGGLSALEHGNSYIGIEKHEPYFAIAERRIKEAESEMPLFRAPGPKHEPVRHPRA